MICNKKNFLKTLAFDSEKNLWEFCEKCLVEVSTFVQKKILSFQKTIFIRNITRLDGGGKKSSIDIGIM
jgi:hypothetical protein